LPWNYKKGVGNTLPWNYKKGVGNTLPWNYKKGFIGLEIGLAGFHCIVLYIVSFLGIV